VGGRLVNVLTIGSHEIFIATVADGPSAIALYLTKILGQIKPDWVINIGTCYGRPDKTKLGDIIISKCVLYMNADGTKIDGGKTQYAINSPVTDLIENMICRDNWKIYAKSGLDTHNEILANQRKKPITGLPQFPVAKIGVIASTDQLVIPVPWESAKQNVNEDIVGVEREGKNVCMACENELQCGNSVKYVLIKGVSNINGSEDDSFKTIASILSASFARVLFEFLVI
jgi:nucleoside phosphorylase